MKDPSFRTPFYRLLAVLIDYPGAQFGEILAEAEAFLASARGPQAQCADGVLEVIGWMRGQSLLDLQKSYVETFDLTPANSLHLTFHLLEEQDRRRGGTLIGLLQHYAASGLRLARGELPDYLPAVLEYASTLDERAASRFLATAEEALKTLEHNLLAAHSPYATLIRAARTAASRERGAMPAVAAGAQP